MNNISNSTEISSSKEVLELKQALFGEVEHNSISLQKQTASILNENAKVSRRMIEDIASNIVPKTTTIQRKDYVTLERRIKPIEQSSSYYYEQEDEILDLIQYRSNLDKSAVASSNLSSSNSSANLNVSTNSNVMNSFNNTNTKIEDPQNRSLSNSFNDNDNTLSNNTKNPTLQNTLKSSYDDVQKFNLLRKAIKEATSNPSTDKNQLLKLFSEMATLSADFLHIALSYGKTIIEEMALDESQMTIKPIQNKGVLGGAKYIVGNIYFKFAIDKANLFAGSGTKSAPYVFPNAKYKNR